MPLLVVIALVSGAIIAVTALIAYLAYLVVYYKLAKDGHPRKDLIGPEKVFRRPWLR